MVNIYGREKIKIERDSNGVPHIYAKNAEDLYKGMGYCHARDRGMQMLLMRILGHGQASQYLESSDEILEVDIFFRRINFLSEIKKHLSTLSTETTKLINAYCNGVNQYFSNRIPLEFTLLGYKPEVWKTEDIFLILRIMGYVSLAQSQFEIERLLIQMVQADVSKEKLDELFPDLLNNLDIELIKQINLSEKIVPDVIKWQNIVPRMIASNNWVISGKKTKSGKAILANDPHLETNRLPNIWYELVLKIDDYYLMGATVPGAPGFPIGRTKDLAWGVTYSFSDTVDSWIENCKDGKFLNKENEWEAFRTRKEVIKRKNKADEEIIFHENEHGTLDKEPLQDGYYLSTQFVCRFYGAKSIESIIGISTAKNVEEGMKYLGEFEPSFNFVLADSSGNIGYQMSGLIPERKEGINGLVPLPGWDKNNDWQGFIDYKDLPRCQNPENNFFVTANNNLNKYGKTQPINVCMASYRADRIKALLEKSNQITVEDNYKIQNDVYSFQAEKFMKILKPLLPDTKQGKILKDWNFNYDIESKGAYLFEKVYWALLEKVFGENSFGIDITNYLTKETGIFIDFYENFDRILLSEKSVWFSENRDELYKKVLEKFLDTPVKKWKDVQKLPMNNIFFNGKLPAILGFDKTIPLKGGRSTVHQGQIYRSGNRLTSFTPSYRIVTDFKEDKIYTNLAGGPSDRRFSKWYTSDLDNWLNGNYKILEP